MRIKKHDLSKFSDLGTIVLYPTRTFHTEIQGKDSKDKDKIIEKSTTNTILYSTNLTSEYSDFAKYDFRFNLPETDYWSTLLPNLYDYKDTIEKFGEGFDSYSENLVPQLSTDDIKPTKHFFGKMTYKESTIFLIKIPREIEISSNSLNDPKTVWKVEFYNERLTSNNKRGKNFIDYDVLSVYSPEDIEFEPILSVYFGPSWNTQISDHTLGDLPDEYLSRYSHPVLGGTCLTEGIYNGFENYMSKGEYLKSTLEEINSDRILYIINTTDGEIETIDMFSAGYSESYNKHRKLNTTTLRNDETLGYNILEKHGDMVFDSRSSVILGLGGKISDCPLFSERANRISFSESSSSGETVVSGKTYIHPKETKVFGENPEISPYWIAPELLKKSMFNHFYITKTGEGNINPGGMVYLRSDRDLEINYKSNKGNEFEDIPGYTYTKDGDKLILSPENGSRINIVFKEGIYQVDLKVVCQRDYPNYGVYREYSISSLSEVKIKLIYLSESGEEVLYKGEKIDFSCSKPFIFRFDTNDSLYKLSGTSKFFFLDDPNVYITEKNGYYYLTIEDTPEKLLETPKVKILGSIESKQYTINIETSKEIQVSTKKKTTLEYGDSFSADFSYEGDKNIKFTVINGDTKEVEESGVWKITKIEDGCYNFSIQKCTKQNPDDGVKNNYRIIVSV